MTLGSHQKTVGDTQTWITPQWITPQWIIDELGPFDLDPCAAETQPWPCAKHSYKAAGLERDWVGTIWLNPPFDRYQVSKWVEKLADHGKGIALLHARTETDWFLPAWQRASGIMFLSTRLHFHYPDGARAKANSGAPACLVSFGTECLQRLENSKMGGWLVKNWAACPSDF